MIKLCSVIIHTLCYLVLTIGKILQFIVNNRKKASNSITDISFGTAQTYSVYPQTDKQTKPKLLK